MKNNFKIIIIILIHFIFVQNIVFSKEINFKANEILTYDSENTVVGKDNAEAKIDDEIEIYADKITYNKSTEEIFAEGNVLVIDLLNDIKINSNKINYNKNENIVTSFNKTFFEIKNKYQITSEDVSFNIKEDIIYSDKDSVLIDNIKNEIKLSSFKYLNNTETLKGRNIEIKDNKKNKYFLSEGMLKLNDYALLGKDIKIFLRNDTYGNPENEPKLKGNSIFYHNDITRIKKGIFTLCGENNNCPPWSITSERNHSL